MPFDLILFDLDGTLIETAPEILHALNDSLRAAGLPVVLQDQVDRWIGHGTRELLIQALAHVGQTTIENIRHSEALGAINAEFDRNYQKRCGTRSQLYPHARTVLQQLRARSVKLALVTNKEERFTRSLLGAHELSALFDRVISGDSLPSKKPDPAGIQSCLDQFQVPPDRALYVGDSSIEVATARNAGIAVWVLPYGYNQGQPIAASQADRVIDDLSWLLNAGVIVPKGK
jgi:phosphoglycolate phosphatase